MRARRALLYTPGDNIHKLKKATRLGVDCLCMDLEDGVALSRKSEAREYIVEALTTLDFGQSERLVRINPVGSGFEQDDINTVIPARPDGIVIPKVNAADEIHWAHEKISVLEQEHSIPEAGIGLIAIIESARGIINLPQISSASSRLQALIFGAEDFASDVGAVRTTEAWEVFYARSAVVTHAAAFYLQAIDMVHIDFEDIDALKNEALLGAKMGFSGKQIIHPNQVHPVQEAFTPSDMEIEQVLALLQAFEAHQEAGIGAFAINGKMIDAPLARSAERILVRARAAGKL